MKMDKLFLIIGAVSGFLSVATGAFAAHALRQRLSSDMLSVFETGTRYQMYHALALLAVAWTATRHTGVAACFAGWCFVAGTVLFSGSLYLLALTGARMVGAVTPLGGLTLLLGWLSLAWSAVKQ